MALMGNCINAISCICRITNALKERWIERSPQERDKENQFTRILLKLPQAADAFNSVRATFQAFDKENKGYIEFSDLSRVFEQLGANFSSEEIGQVFRESDMMEDGRLNFKEFLVCLAIGFVLHKIPSLEDAVFNVSLYIACAKFPGKQASTCFPTSRRCLPLVRRRW
ncbi:hypothetical protein V7S43_005946 [Phytophthora oleae]|uniref:EF-hand domain-containing protein n=1 Tax=Phytophthora oleae TaxID=2107226 RepID=A0ABD3FRV0_9STRA